MSSLHLRSASGLGRSDAAALRFLLLLTAMSACHGSPLQVTRSDGSTHDGRESRDLTDARDASDASEPATDGPCLLLCPASSTNVKISGSVSLPKGDAETFDVDSLFLTVCVDDLCATLPREPAADAQAPAWVCGDDGSGCAPKMFGGSGTSGVQYASVAIAWVAGDRHSVIGSVAFPLSRDSKVAAGATRLSLRSGDATLLDVTSGGCAISMGCCGNLPYQSCSLTW